jgi:hypothetical protein
MLNVLILSVIILNVVILSVAGTRKRLYCPGPGLKVPHKLGHTLDEGQMKDKIGNFLKFRRWPCPLSNQTYRVPN